MKIRISILLVLLGLIACQSTESIPDVSHIDTNITINRFEKDLFEMKEGDMQLLQSKYPEFFPFYVFEIMQLAQRNMPDSVIAQKINNYITNNDIRTVYTDVEKTFPSIQPLQDEINHAFKYIKYYFPQAIQPKVLTYIAPFQHQALTIDADLLGIGLDMHLGADYQYYPTAGHPHYLTQTFTPENASVHAVKAYATAMLPEQKEFTKMIDKMIYNGKILYFLDKVMPHVNDYQKIGYTPNQITWCEENEKQMWAYFLEKNWIYENSSAKYNKYVNPGPTSQGMPPESPGNTGSWIGWQIVKQFAKNNPNISLSELWQINDGQKILKMAKYKP